MRTRTCAGASVEAKKVMGCSAPSSKTWKFCFCKFSTNLPLESTMLASTFTSETRTLNFAWGTTDADCCDWRGRRALERTPATKLTDDSAKQSMSRALLNGRLKVNADGIFPGAAAGSVEIF